MKQKIHSSHKDQKVLDRDFISGITLKDTGNAFDYKMSIGLLSPIEIGSVTVPKACKKGYTCIKWNANKRNLKVN